MDRARKLITDRIAELGLDMSSLSLSMGKNHAYLQQFLKRGVPVELKEGDREMLARHLHIEPDDLRISPREMVGTSLFLSERPSRDALVPATPELAPGLAGVAEIKAALGAGSAGDGEMGPYSVGLGENISADVVRDVWGIPDAYLQGELRTTRSRVRILEVRGDSMLPTLLPGDRVMVDLTDRRPSPAGLFALWDGVGVAVKRLEHIPNSDPPMFKIISDNVERHGTYQRTGDEINVIGRVIWLSRRI